MEQIPPEIWEQIFANLLDSRDNENASKSNMLWRDLLEYSKSSWMFGQAFPMFLEYLSKPDILNCREVCRHWCYGVDHFLENNPYRRPTLQEFPQNPTSNFQTDSRTYSLWRLLLNKRLLYQGYNGSRDRREQILREASSHPNCRLVGRTMYIKETRTPKSTNTKFLKYMGKHIWFLEMKSINFTPLETIQWIQEMLTYVPNLKSLRIICHISTRPTRNSQQDTLNSPETIFTQNLPKFEALKISVTAPPSLKLHEILLKCLQSENLQSLQINCGSSAHIPEYGHLVDLSLSINSDDELSRLLLVKSPIRRLALSLSENFHGSVLFMVVNHFKESLRNFEMTLELSEDIRKNPVLSRKQFILQMKPFSDCEILSGLKCLKRVTLTGSVPISLNFLCGLPKCLEYLHISLVDLDKWRRVHDEPLEKFLEFTETLDLLKYVAMVQNGNKSEIYRSNIWTKFAKLRILTVNFANSEHEYRRDIYDKLKSISDKH